MIIEKPKHQLEQKRVLKEQNKESITVPIKFRYRLTNDLFYNDCGDKCQQQTYFSCLNLFKVVIKAIVQQNICVSVFFDILDKYPSLPTEDILIKLRSKGDEQSLGLADQIERFNKYAKIFNSSFLQSPNPPIKYVFDKEMESYLLDLVKDEFQKMKTPALISIRGWNGKEFKIIQASFNRFLIQDCLGWDLDEYLLKCAVSNQPELIPREEYLNFNRFLMKACFNQKEIQEKSLNISLLNKNHERVPVKIIKRDSKFESASLVVSVFQIEQQPKEDTQNRRQDSGMMIEESTESEESVVPHVLRPEESKFLYGHYPELRNVILMYQNQRCGYREINKEKQN